MADYSNPLVNFTQKNDFAISLVLLLSSVFIIISHLYMYLASKDSNWIGSSGAFITIAGIVFSSFQLLKTEYAKEKAKIINQTHFDKINSKYVKIYLVQLFMVLGTCVWSYAWLLN